MKIIPPSGGSSGGTGPVHWDSILGKPDNLGATPVSTPIGAGSTTTICTTDKPGFSCTLRISSLSGARMATVQAVRFGGEVTYTETSTTPLGEGSEEVTLEVTFNGSEMGVVVTNSGTTSWTVTYMNQTF